MISKLVYFVIDQTGGISAPYKDIYKVFSNELDALKYWHKKAYGTDLIESDEYKEFMNTPGKALTYQEKYPVIVMALEVQENGI